MLAEMITGQVMTPDHLAHVSRIEQIFHNSVDCWSLARASANIVRYYTQSAPQQRPTAIVGAELLSDLVPREDEWTVLQWLARYSDETKSGVSLDEAADIVFEGFLGWKTDLDLTGVNAGYPWKNKSKRRIDEVKHTIHAMTLAGFPLLERKGSKYYWVGAQ